MRLIIKPNPDIDFFINISKAVEQNEGYCPCMIEQTEDTKCICKDFKEQNHEGLCHCKRFIKMKAE